MTAAAYYYNSGGVMTKVPCDQDPHDDQTEARSNLPEAMTINVWNLRFMAGDALSHGSPLIAANLVQKAVRRGDFLVTGTITNLGPLPLKHILIRTGHGLCRFPQQKSPTTAPASTGQGMTYQNAEPADGLESGASIAVDQALNANDPFVSPVTQNNMGYGFGYGNTAPLATDGEFGMRCACAVSLERYRRINELLAGSDDVACVYAVSPHVPPAVKLESPQAIEDHWQVIRAVVALGRQ
jgi:hypothetical protein